ncbi:MAG: CsbD family protein [Bdellovibrio sp.]|nr:CsbD family protein [Bdellovibrio sp.]
MNKDVFQGKIKEMSGELRKKWGELTDDDIKKTKGNAQALQGLVQQKVGLSKEEAQREVNSFMNTFTQKYEKGVAKLNHGIDQVKDKFSH